MNSSLINTTTFCNFSSISDVLSLAGNGNLNVSNVALDCPGVCTLAWGKGNPDLSGIGANVSYIIQTILTFFFGPLYVFIYGYRRKLNLSRNSQDLLKGLQSTFLDVSATFTIPVAVAAVVRLHQSPPFFEMAFLQSLTTMQFLGLLSSTIASGISMPKESTDIYRILVLVLYVVVDFGFFMGVIGLLRTSKASWVEIHQLSSACQSYGTISPGLWYAAKAPNLSAAGRKTFKEILEDDGDDIIIAFVVGIILGVVLLFYGARGLFWLLTQKHAMYLGPMSIAFCIGSFVCLVQLQWKRNVMKDVSGTDFEDDQWGFGQVIALFLWAPLLIQGFYYAVLMLLPEKNGAVIDCHQCNRCRTCYRCVELNEDRILPVVRGRTESKGQYKTNVPLEVLSIVKNDDTSKGTDDRPSDPFTDANLSREGNEMSTGDEGTTIDQSLHEEIITTERERLLT